MGRKQSPFSALDGRHDGSESLLICWTISQLTVFEPACNLTRIRLICHRFRLRVFMKTSSVRRLEIMKRFGHSFNLSSTALFVLSLVVRDLSIWPCSGAKANNTQSREVDYTPSLALWCCCNRPTVTNSILPSTIGTRLASSHTKRGFQFHIAACDVQQGSSCRQPQRTALKFTQHDDVCYQHNQSRSCYL